MESKTFVLKKTKEFRRHVRLFIKKSDGKVDQRNVTFTTEHKVQVKDRNKNARNVAAEFSTNNEVIYDALLRSHAYGKTYVLKDDPEGKQKREPFDIRPVDAKRVALKNLFKSSNLQYDESKSTEVLEQEYQIYMNVISGKEIKEGKAKEIPHVKVDVAADIAKTTEAARKLYEERYGEPVPEDFKNDKAFLSALPDPKFDAKAYMEKASTASGPENEGENIESLQAAYKDKFNVNVPNPKKNDIDWIKKKLAE